MPVQRKISLLDPSIRGRAVNFTAELESLAIPYVLLETKRSDGVHAAYKAQGREPLEDVNALRRAEGLYELTEEENKKVITNTIHSKHQDGLAFDLAPMKNGKVWWKAPEEVWLEIAVIGEKFGLKWGGRWGQTAAKLGWDCPHYEL